MHTQGHAGWFLRLFIVPLVLAGGLTGGASAASAASCQNWTGAQPPNNPGDATQLLGVAVLPGCRAWAVGDNFTAHDGDVGLIEHWNGADWRPVANPNPGVATFLSGVHADLPQEAVRTVRSAGYSLEAV